MKLDDLLLEAKKLSRSAQALTDQESGDPVGYWYGMEEDGPVISLKRDDAWVLVSRINGKSSVTTSTELPKAAIPLYASQFDSLPPLDAIFLLGTEKIESYLAENKWQRDWGFNGNFKDPVAHEYERYWQNHHPFYQGSAVAITGGWHFAWPEDDWPKHVQKELVLWTLRESEPWIEVFFDGSNYEIFDRIT